MDAKAGEPTPEPNSSETAPLAARPPRSRRALAAWALFWCALLALAIALDARVLRLAAELRGAIQRHTGGPTSEPVRFLLQFYARAPGVLTVALLLAWREPRRARLVAFLAAVLATGALNAAVKGSVGRMRPAAAIHHTGSYATHFGGFGKGWESSRFRSFPSGHTATAMAESAVLAAFYPRAAPLFYGLAVLAGAERIYHEKHYPSDVVAGMMLALATVEGLLRSRRFERWCRRLARERPLPEGPAAASAADDEGESR